MFIVNRDEHRSNYTCISNTMLRDARMSLPLRAFMMIILSLPDDWDFSVNGMARYMGINKETVLRYIRELESLGYARVANDRKAGRFTRKSYTFYEISLTEEPSAEIPHAENAPAEKPHPEKPHAENAPAEKPHPEKPHVENAPAEKPYPEKPHVEKTHVEDPSPCNAFSGNSVTEEPVTEDTAAGIPVTEITAQSITCLSNPEYKQNTERENTIHLSREEEKELSFSEAQINADALRGEFGEECIGSVVGAITDCLEEGRLTVGGRSVDAAELEWVMGEVCEQDIREVLESMEGRSYRSFRRYFMSSLYNHISDRLTRPRSRRRNSDRYPSTFDCDEVMREVMAKYR